MVEYKEKEIRNYSGGTIKFRVAEKDEISVLEVGYAITPDGEFIPVIDGEDHASIFTNYITAYLGKENLHLVNEILNISLDSDIPVTLNTLESGTVLTSLNHVIYYGLRPEDVREVYQQKDNVGYCIIMLPNNYSEILTNEQRESIIDLINTNKSIFGNREKVSLHIHVIGIEEELNQSEFIEEIKSRGL